MFYFFQWTQAISSLFSRWFGLVFSFLTGWMSYFDQNFFGFRGLLSAPLGLFLLAVVSHFFAFPSGVYEQWFYASKVSLCPHCSADATELKLSNFLWKSFSRYLRHCRFVWCISLRCSAYAEVVGLLTTLEKFEACVSDAFGVFNFLITPSRVMVIGANGMRVMGDWGLQFLVAFLKKRLHGEN